MVVSRARRCWFAALGAAALAAASCSDPPARVRVVPLGGACSQPDGGNTVRVTAYTATGEHSESVRISDTAAIADFPADTEQIGIEVLIDQGVIGAAGKSAPLAYGALADRATIPVFMAPPDGFCALGGLTEPRANPLIARAGRGALLVGGTGANGPLSTAEYYDPDSASFVAVDVPTALRDDTEGFAGAALATLPDGRVALIGGPRDAFIVFDPETRSFVTQPVLIDPRAFHAAIAIGPDDVLVAGGCSGVAGGRCSGVPRRQILRYHLADLSVPDPSALLPQTQNLRISAQLFDQGIQLDGQRRYLLAGGSGDPGLADRFALGDEQVASVPGGHTQPVALDGGAVLTAFGDDAADDPAAAVVPPDAPVVRTIARAPLDAHSVRLIALEDGRVAGFGTTGVVIYDPTRDAWTSPRATAAPPPGTLVAPSLVRLADGSVLVTGIAGSTQAWLYRPSLVGPATGSVTAVPLSEVSRGVLTPLDPISVTRGAPAAPVWRLSVPDGGVLARALVGGPRTATGSIHAVVQLGSGGLALIAQYNGPGQAILVRLVPGEPAALARIDAGVEHAVCSGSSPLPAFDPAVVVDVRFTLGDRDARLSVADREVLACGAVASERGAWGIAALGAGASLTVHSITVAR